MPLHEAVRRFIRPGMTIHHGAGYSVPMAAHYEIVRQFWGKNPQFTLVARAVVPIVSPSMSQAASAVRSSQVTS